MPSELIVPSIVEAVIQNFEGADKPFTEFDVQSKLGTARASLENPSDTESLGAWAEVLAFALVGTRQHQSPWGTFYGPVGTGEDGDGKTVYYPDIAQANGRVIDHWKARAKSVSQPVLKSRYADLAWDLCTSIAGTKRDPEMARLAIDAYLLSIPVRERIHDRFEAALRALDLASLLRDQVRIPSAKAALLELHRSVITTGKGPWWLAIDRLIDDQRSGVTEEERQQLIADLEGRVLSLGDASDAERFNPHALQDAADRLIRHYRRLGKHDDVKRLHKTVAQAFERFADISDPMVASSVLQSAVNAYRKAGLRDECQRLQVVMQERIAQSRDHMGVIETEQEISREDMEAFLDTVVADDLGSTFARIASEFLPRRREIEDQIRHMREEAPIQAEIPITIMADDHVAARLGSVDDDPFGRLVWQTDNSFEFSRPWLQTSLSRTIETYEPLPEHFVSWTNRLGIFDDLTFLIEGVRAWYADDLVAAVHIIVPQVERGLRSIMAKLGKPVTKPHGKVADVGVAIGMGDILYTSDLTQALGPDLSLYFLALYADPRGKNLRNRVAHGLIKPQFIDGHLVNLLIHTLLVFGVWKELAEKRR